MRGMNRRAFLVRSTLSAAAGALVAPRLFAADATPAAPATPAAGTAPAPAPAASAIAPTPKVEFKPLRGDVGCAFGRGGTIGWLANADAVVAVDSAFPDVARQVVEGLPGRAGRSFDFLINTHHHGDHTGGNGTFRPHARSILAHANVPALQRSRSRNPDAEVVADTTITDRWRRDFGSEAVEVRYFGAAHTKGDIAVHFEKANVTHVGDLMFNRIYPVIDRPGGASIAHWIAVLDEVAKTYPADTIYIFGHAGGKFPVTGAAADLAVFRDYLTALLAHVDGLVKAGKTKEEIAVSPQLAAFPDHHDPSPRSRWSSNLGTAYEELTGGAGK